MVITMDGSITESSFGHQVPLTKEQYDALVSDALLASFAGQSIALARGLATEYTMLYSVRGGHRVESTFHRGQKPERLYWYFERIAS